MVCTCSFCSEHVLSMQNVVALIVIILLLVCRKVAIINLDPANDALPYPFLLILVSFEVNNFC